MHIFIIHKNMNEVQFLKGTLESAQHTVDFEMDNELIQEYLISENFDLIIINSNLHDLDAMDIIAQYRAEKKSAPILFLSEARDGIQAGIIALETGADDFILTTPINIKEFLARVNVLYRRSTGQYQPIFKFGPVEVDSLLKRYKLDGKKLELSKPEGKILETLVKQPERIVTKEKIASNLFSIEDQICTSRVEPHVSRLRKKIQHPDIEIKTIYRSGYSLVLKEG